jgi:hypothetical protein
MRFMHVLRRQSCAPTIPRGNFDEATFDRSATAFNNPDYDSIVIHNCRWRLGLAEVSKNTIILEARLTPGPIITVPAITPEGDANRRAPSAQSAPGGPQAFAQAVVDANTYSET